jgi:c-di-GMP-binding flagellar brake protein YcgR
VNWAAGSVDCMADSTQKPSEKRRAVRTRLATPARVRVTNGCIREYDSLTRDFSSGGIYVYSNATLEPGSEIEIIAMLPQDLVPGGAWVCCHARVVRVDDDPTRGRGIAAVIERLGVVPEA